jgi:hypothetical protein
MPDPASSLLGHSDSAPKMRGRVEFARRYLTNLYDEAREIPDGTTGKYVVESSISDAIDQIDRALSALGPS